MEYFIERQLLNVFSMYFGFKVVEMRERVQRFNCRLSIYVYDETDAKHHRPHAHILVNNRKCGTIWIDTFEVENASTKDTSQINAWLKNHKEDLIAAWKRNNNRIDIDFFSYGV